MAKGLFWLLFLAWGLGLGRGVMTYLGSEPARCPCGTPSAPNPGTFGASGFTWRRCREVGRVDHRILNTKKGPSA